ncbi:hypothetical protein BGW80DRAFT_1460056 [Lactifluus volemus]|nr:hypothetical protein BGW80DRAFT_1460056 [Lactifluus volemus]
MLPIPPDPSLRQPLTLSVVLPVYTGHYAMAVLAMLPNTFILKLSLLPFIIWQAWTCAVGFDSSLSIAQWLGYQTADRLVFWNFPFVVRFLSIVMSSIEWTFTKRPLRKYELQNDQATLIERPLSVSGVLLDAFDLIGNQRGIGWSCSSNPFPREVAPSLASLWAKLLLKITLFDMSLHIIHRVCPASNNVGGGSLFDPSLGFLHRHALAVLSAICGSVWAYTVTMAASLPPALAGYLASRIWGFRWHQFYRQTVVVFGARPGGALLGKPGALVGAFTASAIIHYIVMWGLGHGMEFRSSGGYYLLMGLGAIMESAFKQTTGLRVQGWVGWLWTMLWTTLWVELVISVEYSIVMGFLDPFNPFSPMGFFANLNGTFPERLIPDGLTPRLPIVFLPLSVSCSCKFPRAHPLYVLAVLVQLPPFVRERFSLLPPDAPQDFQTQLKGALLNAFDLTFNSRGIGWNWGKGIYTPPSSGPVPQQGALDFLIARGTFHHPSIRLIATAEQSSILTYRLFALRKSDRHDLHRSPRLCTSFQATYYAVGFIAMSILVKLENNGPHFQSPWMATSLEIFGVCVGTKYSSDPSSSVGEAGWAVFRTSGRSARRILRFGNNA